jgi:hypothetical protein
VDHDRRVAGAKWIIPAMIAELCAHATLAGMTVPDAIRPACPMPPGQSWSR